MTPEEYVIKSVRIFYISRQPRILIYKVYPSLELCYIDYIWRQYEQYTHVKKWIYTHREFDKWDNVYFVGQSKFPANACRLSWADDDVNKAYKHALGNVSRKIERDSRRV